MIDWLRNIVGRAPTRTEAVREARGRLIDPDDDEWRRLTGDTGRDLTGISQIQMQRIAPYLWRLNLLANRLIELPVAYILADGVKLGAKDEAANGYLRAFWSDPINSMDIKLPQKLREMAIYGEQCWPAFTDPYSGLVRLGYLAPERIETVVLDPDNMEQPIGVVSTADSRKRKKRYRVIVNGPETMFTERARRIREEDFLDGECFFFRVNNLAGTGRGLSDLLAPADWLDCYEQFLFGEVDRAKFLRSFLWDVTLTGADQPTIDARARNMHAPMPNSVRVHNETEEWKALSPSLGSTDADASARLFRNHILGGSSIPEHWYGGGGDVNRATASEMGEPAHKVYLMRQSMWRYILVEVGKFVINRRMEPRGLQHVIDPHDPDPDLLPQVDFPTLVNKDTSKYAAAMQQVVVGSQVAVADGLLTRATAVRLIQSVAERLGVEFDAEAELQAAEQEAAARREEDNYTEPPANDDGNGDGIGNGE